VYQGRPFDLPIHVIAAIDTEQAIKAFEIAMETMFRTKERIGTST
jgi:hypothetical protein